MRKAILATASAIALGIAGATPLYAQNTTTSPTATPAPTQDQGTAAGTTQPSAPPASSEMQQTPPATGASNTNPDMASSSQSGGNMGQGQLSRADIQQVQQKLQQDGLYHGRIDGVVGRGTQQALRAFQQKNNLPETGTLDQQTLASLNGTGGGVGSSTMPNSGNEMTPPPSSSGAASPNSAPSNQKY